MAWLIELSEPAKKALEKLDRGQAKRITQFLHERVENSDNPRNVGSPLQGVRFGEFWKYRVGDYRLICQIQDNRMVVLVVQIGHRREIYR